LNLALPKKGKGPFPAVVCIHGGGWRAGKRQDMDFMTEVLARRGYVAATVGYRLVPNARFPAQIEDCKAAVRWLRANAAKYHMNPDRIGAIGPSAGGHLACLLGITDKKGGLEGSGGNPDHSSRVQAVVSFFGRTNFTRKTWTNQLEEEVFVPLIGASFDDKPELYKRISPIAYVSDAVARGHERSSDARAGSPAIKGPQRQRGWPLPALRAEEGIPTGFNETERRPRRNSSSSPLPQFPLDRLHQCRAARRSNAALASRVCRASGSPFASRASADRASELPMASSTSIARSARNLSPYGLGDASSSRSCSARRRSSAEGFPPSA